MPRRSPRLARLLALAVCLPLPAADAGAITIDTFSGTPELGTYDARTPNGLGQILPFTTTGELDYLGDLLGMTLAYDLPSGTDLTESSNTALTLRIRSLVPSSGPVTLAVTVNGVPLPVPVEITEAGTVLIPYASFPDASIFANVNDLRLVFTASTSFAFAADDLQAVPEPRTAAMLGLGLLGLAFARRREPPIGAPRIASGAHAGEAA